MDGPGKAFTATREPAFIGALKTKAAGEGNDSPNSAMTAARYKIKRRRRFILPALLALAVVWWIYGPGKDWPPLKYSSVKAYAWPVKKPNGDFLEMKISSGMQPPPEALNPEGTVLSQNQVKRLVRAVSGRHSKHALASCYNPHNAFIFFSGSQPVAFVEICFECLSHRVGPGGGADFPDLVALAEIFTELKLPLGEYRDAAEFKVHFAEAPPLR